MMRRQSGRPSLKTLKNVVFWGTDPLVTDQISWQPPTHDGYLGIKKIKEAGIKLIAFASLKTTPQDTLL